MTIRRLIASTTILLSIGSVASAQIVTKKNGLLFNVSYKKGQVIKQNMSMQAVGNPKQSTSQFVTKCLDVDKNGGATLQITVPAAGKVKSSTKKIKVDRHGKPVGTNIEGYSGNFVWPDTPVKIGQSWIGDLNMAGPGQGANAQLGFKSTYKLTGVKNLNGAKVAVIAANIKVSGTYDISGTGLIYVKFSDGQLQSADFDMALNQFTNSNTQTKLKLKMAIRTVK